jgi:hypothetical protein
MCGSPPTPQVQPLPAPPPPAPKPQDPAVQKARSEQRAAADLARGRPDMILTDAQGLTDPVENTRKMLLGQ